MGITIWLFFLAVILIVFLLILTVLSPDNWGGVSANCNANCSPSSQTASSPVCQGNGSSSSGVDPPQTQTGNNKDLMVTLTDRYLKEKEDLKNHIEKSDPYHLIPFNHPLWEKYNFYKKESEKKDFAQQSTFVVSWNSLANKWKPWTYFKSKSKHLSS